MSTSIEFGMHMDSWESTKVATIRDARGTAIQVDPE